MAGSEQPGKAKPAATAGPGPTAPGERRSARRLEQPPSARYGGPDGGRTEAGRTPVRAVAQAGVAAAVGAALLFLVGAVVASTAGLLFISGVMGAVVGLLLARAAVPTVATQPGDRSWALTRGRVVWIAIGLSVLAIAVAAVATWLYAMRQGGTLGLLDYLLQTFGPFLPGELIAAALGAVWGASSAPREGS